MTAYVVAPRCSDSLALAVVGAMAGNAHLRHYCDHRRAAGDDPETDGLHELRTACADLGWANIAEAADRLAATGVLTAEHFREAHSLNPARLAQVWHAVPGQASGHSWTLLLALTGLGPRQRRPGVRKGA